MNRAVYRDKYKLLALFLVCLSINALTVFEVIHVLAVPSPSRSSTVTPGSMVKACRAIVTKDGSQAVDLDGFTGDNNKVSGTDDAVIQDAMNNILDSGRVTKEVVCLIGSFTLTATLRIPNYTIFDARQASLTFGTNAATSCAGCGAMIQNVDSDSGQGCYPCTDHDIEIWGGIWDGNAANQVNEANRAAISFRNTFDMFVFNPTIQHFKGLAGITMLGVAGMTNAAGMNGNIIAASITDVFGTSQSESGNGILITCNDCTVDNVEVTNTRQGIMAEGSFPTNSWNVISNNYVHDLRASDGIQGIYILTMNATILQNDIVRRAGTAGAIITNSNFTQVTGGQYNDNSQRLSNYPGIGLVSSRNCTVTGVTALNQKGSSGPQFYGIQDSGAGAGSNLISGNNVQANANLGISIAPGLTDIVINNLGYNPQPISSNTAGASPFTTVKQPYPQQVQLTTVNGQTGWTCNGIAMSNTALTYSPLLRPGQTCTLTWATTAPVYELYPQ